MGILRQTSFSVSGHQKPLKMSILNGKNNDFHQIIEFVSNFPQNAHSASKTSDMCGSYKKIGSRRRRVDIKCFRSTF